MDDSTCVAFLQWALPRLGLRWAGYRRVRRMAGKRIDRRLRALGLADVAAYRAYLELHADEWRVLDGLCRIPISRFFRDRAVFAELGDTVLPALAQTAAARGARRLRCWSAGCASGEEAYSLSLLWTFEATEQSPGLAFEIVATDADPHMLERARAALYKTGSLKELPAGWRERAFTESDGLFALRGEYRSCVIWLCQDIRAEAPPGRFDLVLCRNMAFTYFAGAEQQDTLDRIFNVLVPDGALVIGSHESLPEDATGFVPWAESSAVYRKSGG